MTLKLDINLDTHIAHIPNDWFAKLFVVNYTDDFRDNSITPEVPLRTISSFIASLVSDCHIAILLINIQCPIHRILLSIVAILIVKLIQLWG